MLFVGFKNKWTFVAADEIWIPIIFFVLKWSKPPLYSVILSACNFFCLQVRITKLKRLKLVFPISAEKLFFKCQRRSKQRLFVGPEAFLCMASNAPPNNVSAKHKHFHTRAVKASHSNSPFIG